MLEQAWSAYGYRLGYKGSLDLRLHVPPNWLPLVSGAHVDAEVECRGLEIFDQGQLWTVARDEEHLLLRLLQLLQMRLTWGAEHLTFLHAAVVRRGDGLWVMPGEAGSGKSTLARALVQAGGQFYSDELAVCDDQGLVHAYPRDLWVRVSKKQRRRVPAADLGWTSEAGPARVQRVLLCTFRSRAQWSPRQLTWPEALPWLLPHLRCSPAVREQACGRLKRALGSATILQGERGEANQIAHAGP